LNHAGAALVQSLNTSAAPPGEGPQGSAVARELKRTADYIVEAPFGELSIPSATL